MGAPDAGVRADALLAELEVSDHARRQACITLAGVALRLTGGDPEAAREPLAVALEAPGMRPYEPGGARTMWGVRPSRPGSGEEAQ